MTIDKKKTNEELVAEGKSFFETYKKEIGESIRKGRKVVFVNFEDLASNSPVLAEALIGNPVEILQILETSLEETGLIKNPRIRFNTLPETQKVKIRTIRANHLNQLIFFEGIIRQASDVRPQVVNAKFECPSCGTVISVLQIEKKFREPTRCSCGRKGQFRLMSKTMVDAQRLVIEEAPESLSGGEQPRRMTVFLKEDLVEPVMEEKTTPGSKVRVLGILNEVPLPLPTGSISTRFDLAIEANNVIPLESTYEDLEISDEDERQIEELATDPELFRKLRESIAPSIWGYEEIKEALVLQMFGGVRKVSPDGTVSRGDMHVFLIGDPGVAKSIGKNEKILYISKDNNGEESIENVYKKYGKFPKNLKVLTIDQVSQEPKWENVKEIIKHLPEKQLIKVMTEHGKCIIATKDHSFITLSNKGEIVPIKGDKLTNSTYLPIPINYHKKEFEYFYPRHFNSNNSLPDKIELDKEFGFFIGIFLAQGCISNKTIAISKKNKKIQEKIINFARKIKLNYGDNKKEVCIFSKNLADVLYSYCYDKKEINIKNRAGNIKKIPGFAYFSPKEFIYGIISGLFSGNGRIMKEDKILRGFELTSVSKELIENTSNLLFSIGILNKIKKRQYKNNETYSLRIPAYMTERFAKNIEILGSEIKLDKKLPCYKNPIPCGELVYEIVKRLKINSSINGNRTLAAGMSAIKKRGEIGRSRLLKLIKKLESISKGEIKELEILKKIANSNIIWSKISNIDIFESKEEVYDLSIPSTNTFVANGIGVHNSLTLKFISNIAPRGRYVVGKSASGAGITATVVKDEFLKGWALEAGAMVLANNGIVCIDEIEKMDPQDRSSMHEALEQQCYLPDFELLFSDGSKRKIKEFVDELMEKNKGTIEKGFNCEILKVKNNVEILTTDFESIYPANVDSVSRHIAPDKFIKIILSNGRSITVTPEHPCWKTKGGKIINVPAKELKKSDFFPIPSELPIQGEEQIIGNFSNGPDLCKILGYHIADGCFKPGEEVQFRNNDKRLIEDYSSSIKNYFHINPRLIKNNNQFRVRVISSEVAYFLSNLDKNLLEKGLKKIPEQIMKCRNEDLRFLLRALFDGSGNIEDKGGLRITLASENSRLAEQVGELLLRFGIISSIIRGRKFRIVITGQENILNYFNNIGFLSEEKQKKLANYIRNKPKLCVADIIPDSLQVMRKICRQLKIKHVNPICQEQRISLQRIIKICEEKANRLIEAKEIVNNTKNSHDLGKARKILGLSASSMCKKIGLTRDLLLENETKKTEDKNYQEKLSSEIENMLLAIEDLRDIKKLAFGKIRWSKIKSVKIVKNKDVKWVYDVIIKPTHAFVSNNMILHNSVTISKANVQASLSAKTSVLAAGNPKFGRFEPSQSITEQIDLPPTLLNRFDLIFVLRDLPNKIQDDAIATHVLNMHQKKDKKPDITMDLFKKYVAYAKQKVSPLLTDEAVNEIKNFYVRLRNMQTAGDSKSIPISARQLQGLVRLAEAHAKSRLSSTVDKQDSEVAVRLTSYYLMQVGYDPETKKFDIDRFTTRVSSSQRSKLILIRETIKRLEEVHGKQIPVEILRNEIGSNISDSEFEETIEKLKKSGDIYEPKQGFVQEVGSSKN